jgi:hypothetical protein
MVILNLIIDWGECMEHYGFSAVYKCRKHLSAMNNCLKFWYTDKDFRKECEEIYLEKRKKFRETGIPEKDEKRPFFISKKIYNPKYPDMFKPFEEYPTESNDKS